MHTAIEAADNEGRRRLLELALNLLRQLPGGGQHDAAGGAAALSPVALLPVLLRPGSMPGSHALRVSLLLRGSLLPPLLPQ